LVIFDKPPPIDGVEFCLTEFIDVDVEICPGKAANSIAAECSWETHRAYSQWLTVLKRIIKTAKRCGRTIIYTSFIRPIVDGMIVDDMLTVEINVDELSTLPRE